MYYTCVSPIRLACCCPVLLIVLLFPFLSQSQGKGSLLAAKISLAEDHELKKNYDSALLFCQQVITLSEKNKFQADINYTKAFSIAGTCYEKKADPSLAHDYYTKALNTALKFHHEEELQTAFVSLNQLHWLIIKNNWKFPYVAPPTTIEEEVYFSIEKVEQKGDSLELTIYGGKADGVTDSTFSASVFSRYNNDSTKVQYDFISLAKIKSTATNRMFATMPAGFTVRPKDVVLIRTQVPVYLNKSALKKYALYGITVADNSRLQVFNYRYLSYFFNANTDSIVMNILKHTVAEVVEAYGADTATVEQFGNKIKEGIFTGKNVMLAMHQSTGDDLKYFLDFMADFPGNYIGNNFKFSEIYATWMINNSPMSKADIKRYLTQLKDASQRRSQSYNLRNTITEQNISADWLNNGLLSASFDDLKETQQNSTLLYDFGMATTDDKQVGWSYYLKAVYQEKNDNVIAADGLYKLAAAAFKKAGDAEGSLWVKSALENLTQNASVSFAVQSGHLMNFFLAMSPNPRYFASGSQDNLVKIWDILTGKEIKTIAAHKDEILSINYSPDGRYLVTSSLDTTIKIWNAYNYRLIQTIKTRKPETTAIFTPDSKRILCAGRDSLIKLWDPLTNTLIKTFAKHKARVTGLVFEPKNPLVFLSSSADSMVYKWHLDSTDILRWYKEKGRVLNVKLSRNGLYMTTLTTDSMLNVWYYEKSKRYFSDTIGVEIRRNNKQYSEGDFSIDGKYLAFSNKKKIYIYDLATGDGKIYPAHNTYFLSDLYFSSDGNNLIQKYTLGGGISITDFQNWSILNAPSSLITKQIKQFSNPPVSIQFRNDGRSLAVLSNNLSLYNLSEGTTQFINSGTAGINHQHLLLGKGEHSIMLDRLNTVVYVYDNLKKVNVDSVVFKRDEKIMALTLGHKDSTIFLGGEKGTLLASSTYGHQTLFTNGFYRDDDTYIKRLNFDSIHNRLYVTMDYNKIFVVNATTGKVVDSITGKEIYDVAAMPGAIYVSGADGWIYKYSTKNYRLIKKMLLNEQGKAINLLKMSHDFSRLAIMNGSTTTSVINTATDKLVYEMHDHDYETMSMDFSRDDKILATSGIDNKINLYELATGKLMLSLHTPYEEDFVASDPQGHYMAPKKSLDGVVFNYKNNAFSFEQFDLQFNRPDIILSKLGKANPSLVESYHAAYKRRLKKLGLAEDQVKADIHLPLVRILDRLNVRPTTRAESYELQLECYDSKYPLQTLHVLVNNAPLFGLKGKDISALQSKELVQKINVPLSIGNNIIKLYCTNKNGTASLKETFEVYSNYKASTTPKTYFIGIAVANYKDSTMNLTYSAKDVRDLAASFKLMNPRAEIDTLIDDKATRQNILALKKKLEATTVNDKIVMAVTGHGLLSDSLDFYYGTYDIDFKNPATRGLKYEELENILNEIPARQKLLLIDACHSGALDKESLMAQNAIQKTGDIDSVKEVGNRSSIKVVKSKVSLNNTFDLMQNLFADLSSSNGTVVISAAGGLEYAFESAEWNNGVFTYCVRKGFVEEEADKDGGNYDGIVTVQELQQYVSRKVSELTHGRQKPTSRKENLDYDWSIR